MVSEFSGSIAWCPGSQDNSKDNSFNVIPKTIQSVCAQPDLHGKFNILVAELMDNCGLGENIWPFFAAAREKLLVSEDAVVIPRKLSIFAALVSVELAPVG